MVQEGRLVLYDTNFFMGSKDDVRTARMPAIDMSPDAAAGKATGNTPSKLPAAEDEEGAWVCGCVWG